MASEELTVKSFTSVNLYENDAFTEPGMPSSVRQATVLL